MSIHPSKTVLLAAIALTAAALPHSAFAASCTFMTDLKLGSESESVRCLQKYLNANGFMVSTNGVGSTGHETTQYKEKTVAAVKQWQTANKLAASGMFGPLSRAKYAELTTATVPTPTPAPTPTPTPVVTTPVTDTQTESARSAILSAKKALDSAQNDYDDAKDNKDSLGSSKSLLATAQGRLLDSLYAFVNKDYATAKSSASSASSYVKDALNELDGGKKGGNRDDAKAALKAAKDAITDAKRDLDDASSNQKGYKKASDYLSDAQDKYSDANDSYKNEDYEDAVDTAADAKSLAKKASDAL